MANQFQRAGLTSRGWMSFTIPNGGILYMGGPLQTTPTLYLSGGVSSGGFLATGIPQKLDRSAFADITRAEDLNGHAIKTAFFILVSAGATAPAVRFMTDGSVPTTALGEQWLVGDTEERWNSRMEIFNFKAFNRSGGNAIIEVPVFE